MFRRATLLSVVEDNPRCHCASCAMVSTKPRMEPNIPSVISLPDALNSSRRRSVKDVCPSVFVPTFVLKHSIVRKEPRPTDIPIYPGNTPILPNI